MKLNRHRPSQRSSAGMSLLEVLVYIALFFLIAGLAFSLFYRTEEQSRMLGRASDDMVGVLNVGERWRADIRTAADTPVVTEAPEIGIRIPQRGGEVRYLLRSGAIWREAGGKSSRVLERVQASSFERDQREHVTAWRWTIELVRRRTQGSLRPAFSFAAVPAGKPAANP